MAAWPACAVGRWTLTPLSNYGMQQNAFCARLSAQADGSTRRSADMMPRHLSSVLHIIAEFFDRKPIAGKSRCNIAGSLGLDADVDL